MADEDNYIYETLRTKSSDSWTSVLDWKCRAFNKSKKIVIKNLSPQSEGYDLLFYLQVEHVNTAQELYQTSINGGTILSRDNLKVIKLDESYSSIKVFIKSYIAGQNPTVTIENIGVKI